MELMMRLIVGVLTCCLLTGADPQPKQGGVGQGSDYQKYYSNYMPSDKDGDAKGGDYQKYYADYMAQGNGKGGGGPGGDYQKYYSKYMSPGDGNSDGPGGDYKNYYSKYMSQGGADYQHDYGSTLPNVKNWSNKEEVRDAFRKKWAHSNLPDVKNWSNKEELKEAFTKRYAGTTMTGTAPAVALSADEPPRTASRTWLFLAAGLPSVGLSVFFITGKFYCQPAEALDDVEGHYYLQADRKVALSREGSV